MAGNKVEQEIISLFNEDITGLYSINQIATTLKKAYPYTHKKVSILTKEKILKKTIIGRSHLCSVNLHNDEAIVLLTLNEVKKRKQIEEKNPKLARVVSRIKELNKSINIQVALKLGNKIIFVLEDKEGQKVLEKSASLSSYKIKVCDKDRFLKLLLERRDLLDKKTILFGYQTYYNFIEEIEDKLRIKYSDLLR